MIQQTHILIGGAAVFSFAAGTIAGYSYAKKKFLEHLDEQIDVEVRTALSIRDEEEERRKRDREDDERVENELNEETELLGKALSHPEMSPEANEAFKSYRSDNRGEPVRKYHKIATKKSEERVIKRSPDPAPSEVIFNETDIEESEEEVIERNGDGPYIINQDEFMAGDLDFEQVSLTYYEGDRVLVDDQEDPITEESVTDMIGDLNNLQFGHLSKEPHLVYIRNERLGMDLEVSRARGSYGPQVMGEMG